MAHQLLVTNGRVIDPANNLDKKADILVTDGKIAEIGNLAAQLSDKGRTRDRCPR